MNGNSFDNIKNMLKKHFNREYLAENKIMILKASVVTVLVIAALVMFIGKDSDEDTFAQIESIDQKETQTQEETIDEYISDDIFVDISGEVKTPMLAQLPSGSRIDDAIKAAGGLTEKADISNVNRAQILEDGQKILIPAAGETDPAQNVKSLSGAQNTSKVNINTADAEELMSLDGVGPATAEKIITHREEHGSFKSIENIMDVSGIGEKTFEGLKDDISV